MCILQPSPAVGSSLSTLSYRELCRAKLFHGVPSRFLAPQPEQKEPGAQGRGETDAGSALWSTAAGNNLKPECICYQQM